MLNHLHSFMLFNVGPAVVRQSIAGRKIMPRKSNKATHELWIQLFNGA